MSIRDEAVERAALKRREKVGPLSDEAFEELRLLAHEHPEDYVEEAPEQAMLVLAEVLETVAEEAAGDDVLDDEHYMRARLDRLSRVRKAAERALEMDPDCLYAELLALQARDMDPLARMRALRELDGREEREHPMEPPEDGDAWGDVMLRPRLRLKAALARQAIEVASHGLARDVSHELLAMMPGDELGMRYTLAIALARLEDEDGLDELDARFERHGNPWMHLARTLLLYKLDHMAAARRALRGFCDLCEGGAYVLLRPAYVESYLLDRPECAPGSFEQVMQAIHEADPVVVDTPDLIEWASGVPGVVDSAREFARRRGYDW